MTRGIMTAAGLAALSAWCANPLPAGAEWRVLGPMMETPDWLDDDAIDRRRQQEAAEEAEMTAAQMREQWIIGEEHRRDALARSAEAVSEDGGARLGFGCSREGKIYLSLVMSGYEISAGTVRVTHWVDAGLPDRVPWYTAPASLELRAYTDRAFYVEQFLKEASAGESVTLQVNTFPESIFTAPDREEIIAPILENCRELASEIEIPAHLAAAAEEIPEE